LGRESLPNPVTPVALVFAINLNEMKIYRVPLAGIIVLIMLTKIIQFVKKHQADIILVIGVILISLLSFAMGYIAAKQQEKEPIKIEFYMNHASLYSVEPYIFSQSSKL